MELNDLVPFKVSVLMIWGMGPLFPARCPNETNILKLEELKHQMIAFCI